MNLVELSTRRRVTVAMFTILLVLFGLIGLSRLKVNLLPDLSYPTLTVRTEYTGAAPAEIETLITQPMEEVLGTVKNVSRIRSISRTGQSDVVLEFAWGADMDEAGLDVREKIELLQLPLEAEKPLLLRFNPSTEPVVRLGLRGQSDAPETLERLRTFADEELKKRLEPIAGVAAIKISGGLEEEVQIELDPKKLAQLGIDPSLVINRLAQENVNLAGGRLDEANQRFLVRTIAQFATPEAMGELIVTNRTNDTGQSVPVRLRELANVGKGSKERTAIIRVDGREAIEIAIYKEGDANTVAVAAGIRSTLERMTGEDVFLSQNERARIRDAQNARGQAQRALEQTLPADAVMNVIEDQSAFVKSSIREAVEAAIFGGLLSVLVIYLFLGEAWATIVISLSLPVSIIASFFLMQQFGITLNVMSLGGIALATGMVVDNAIVVLENIKRLRDQGMAVMQATIQGTSEVGMAITASTLTHIAVFLPLVFVQGISGQLFRDQALTVTFAMLVSLFVAITLIPMLASLEGKSQARYQEDADVYREPARRFAVTRLMMRLARLLGAPFRLIGKIFAPIFRALAHFVRRSFDGLSRVYESTLRTSLLRPWFVIGIALAFLVSSLLLIPRLGFELIPEFAQNRLQVDLKFAPGTPLNATDAHIAAIQEAGKTNALIESLYSVSGTGTRLDANPTEAGENVGRLTIQLASGSTRADEPVVMQSFRTLTSAIPGLETKFGRPQLFSFDTPLEIEIAGDDLDELKAASSSVLRRMRADPVFSDVKSTLEQGAPEVRIYFDQEKVAALGLSVRQVADQVVRNIRGEVATRYSLRDRKIDVLVRAQAFDRDSLDAVRRLIINPENPRPSSLESVAQVQVAEGPAEIRRSNQERVALISASANGVDLGAAALRAQQILSEEKLPIGMDARVSGQSADMQASFQSLLIALALAVFLVYLVMASQFESLLHPFLIMFSIPLALVGAVYAIYLTGTTVSVIVFIGLIMLVGIVVSNAIVLIDRVNQLRQRGVAKFDALMEGGLTRLRPIVMTTLTTLVGFLPMAIGVGEGAELRAPLAITVVGGLVFSTLLTLVLIPALYQLVDPEREPEAGRRNRSSGIGKAAEER
jgi:hydrophobic/amphiphilic exporter-1 (mainly G- bacteria), HAE1 family